MTLVFGLAVALVALPPVTCAVVFAQLSARRKKADDALRAALDGASTRSARSTQNPPAQG